MRNTRPAGSTVLGFFGAFRARLRATARLLVAGLAGGVLAAAALVWTPTVAHAADVNNLQALQAAFANPSSVADVAKLTETLNSPGTILTLGSGKLTLDLNGNNLTVARIALAETTELVVTDSTDTAHTGAGAGTLSAQRKESNQPGIETHLATLTIEGGNVTAAGGNNAAGIGGGNGRSGGTVVVSGGTVYAEGGLNGAGIGGAKGGFAGTVKVSGGTVTAKGGLNGAGIGGLLSDGSDITSVVTVTGGTVNATGGTNGAGIGGGSGSPSLGKR